MNNLLFVQGMADRVKRFYLTFSTTIGSWRQCGECTNYQVCLFQLHNEKLKKWPLNRSVDPGLSPLHFIAWFSYVPTVTGHHDGNLDPVSSSQNVWAFPFPYFIVAWLSVHRSPWGKNWVHITMYIAMVLPGPSSMESGLSFSQWNPGVKLLEGQG